MLRLSLQRRPRLTAERLTAPACLLLLAGLTWLGCMKSDESVLRDEFDIPVDAILASMRATPETPGWFGREGLEIEAEFAFQPASLQTYRERAQSLAAWQPMPIPDEALMKMTGIRSYLRALEDSNRVLGEAVPSIPARPIPESQQLLESWKERLPLDVASGLWSCRTAGDNIMYAKKVPCSSKAGDLNDFMLAVLDIDTRTLKVHVHTSY